MGTSESAWQLQLSISACAKQARTRIVEVFTLFPLSAHLYLKPTSAIIVSAAIV